MIKGSGRGIFSCVDPCLTSSDCLSVGIADEISQRGRRTHEVVVDLLPDFFAQANEEDELLLGFRTGAVQNFTYHP